MNVLDLFSGALRQPQVRGRVMHTVQQCMTRRAEYPRLLDCGVLRRSPSAVALVLRLVGNVKNARLAAGLARAGRIWMASVEPLEVSVWADLLSIRDMVLGHLSWVFRVEIGSRFPGASNGTFVRTVPAVIFSASAREKLASALSAVSTRRQFPFLVVVAELLLAFIRAELLPSVRRLESGTAFATVFCACHGTK